MLIGLCLLVLSVPLSHALQVNHVGIRSPCFRRQMAVSSADTSLEDHLNANHAIFVKSLLSKNDKAWKAIRQEGSSCTIFAPTDQAFVELGEKRRIQFSDDRNRETVEKIASYHVIGEPVNAEQLFASGGVITMGGDIPVDRSTKGGVFGFGGKEDGGVTINGAKVTETTNIGDCIIHSVDTLVSPSILWRYMDQLRIPGSS